ncbi:GntR family transcriptional regulator [Streptomyces sp. NPDC055025]
MNPLPLTLGPTGRCTTTEMARLGAAGPLVPVSLPGGVPAIALTREGLLRTMLRGPGLSADARRYWSLWPQAATRPEWAWVLGWTGVTSLSAAGNGDHSRLRTVVSPHLAARFLKIEHHVPVLSRHLLRTAANTAGDRPVDLRAHYARPHGMDVICHLLGVPDHLRRRLESPVTRLLDVSVSAGEAAGILSRIESVMKDLVTLKQTHPGDDLTTDLLAGPADGQTLPLMLRQVFGTCLETMVHLITSCAHTLLTSPAGVRGTLAEEHSWNAVAARGLRWSPSAYLPLLFTTEDLSTEGGTIPAGTALLATAALRGTRPGTDPLATRWSAGDHLAETVAAHALRVLFGQHPGIRPAHPHTRRPIRGVFHSAALLAYLPPPGPQDSTPVRFPKGTRPTLEQQGRLARYAMAAYGKRDSLQHIADAAGLSYQFVRELLLMSGVGMRSAGGHPRRAVRVSRLSWLPAGHSTAVTDTDRAVPVADRIAGQITDGTYPPGTKIPTQSEIQRIHGVGLHVARAAVAHLVGRELVTVVYPLGVFVRAFGGHEPAVGQEHVRTRILRDIRSGTWKPGDRLHPHSVRRQLRMPREDIDLALETLAAEGHLEAGPDAEMTAPQRVAALARSYIADGTWPPGTLLPPATSKNRWGAGAPAVSEGLKILAQEGHVRVRRGIGAIVLARPPQPASPLTAPRARKYYVVSAHDKQRAASAAQSRPIDPPPPHHRPSPDSVPSSYTRRSVSGPVLEKNL